MPNTSSPFFVRLLAIFTGVALVAALLVFLASRVAREGREQIATLAGTEISAEAQARQFRGMVDAIHTALLQIGRSADPGRFAALAERAKLQSWCRERQSSARDPAESRVLQELAKELASYLGQLEGVVGQADPTRHEPLAVGQLIDFDRRAVRLQRLADAYAAIHTERLNRVLTDSLASVRRLRDVAYAFLAVLAASILGLGLFAYRDLVRPLRLKLIDTEAALARGEKLAALGTLAAGVAHEIRNPLTAIKARLFALRRGNVDEVVHSDVAAMQHDIERLERIVRDVLEYARPPEPVLATIDLGQWLHEVATFLRPEMEAAAITFDCETGGTLYVQVDAEQMRQVAINLARNAREALEGRPGRITLAAKAGEVRLRGRVTPAAVLVVTDDGPGIPDEAQARLFDPFFTTKANGTGLGLSIVARIVAAHGGEIAFQSAPGRGTRFEVRLRLAPPPSQEDS